MIKAAAIKWNGKVYSVPKPGRHDGVFALMRKENPDHKGPWMTDEQGFITDKNEFVDRIKGAAIAIECGQITQLNWPPLLYSEDLW